jgi:hypothetical protein
MTDLWSFRDDVGADRTDLDYRDAIARNYGAN